MGVSVRENGVTMIELVVVLAILGVLTAIAWPSFTGWQQQSALERDIMVLKGALGKARSRSVQEGLYWGATSAPTASAQCSRLYFGVQATPGSSQLGLIYFCDKDADGDLDAPGEVYAYDTRQLGNGVQVDAATTLTNDRILFEKAGEVFGNAGTVALSVGGRTRSVVIGNTGRIREP